MKKMMSLLMVALVALTISLELRSTAARARLVPIGPNVQVAATTNEVAHQSAPIIAASKNEVINSRVPPVLEAAPKDVLNPQDVKGSRVPPVLEAAPKDVLNPQDVKGSVPSGPLPQSVREVIIPQHCICCGWYYSKYFTNCNKICCE